MKQTAATEKLDPLTRIQEEIKEVVRREQEYRQLTSVASPNNFDDDYEQLNDNANNDNDSSKSLTISSLPTLTTGSVVITSLALADEHSSNTPSLASSVNSKESLDEHHSDDSGISASSSPVNGTSADTNNNNNNNDEELKIPSTPSIKEPRYIGPNCYNMTPEPPQQKLMTRTVSTPHLAASKPRQFTFNSATKGVMQRFIASRGKLQLNNNANGSTKLMLNTKNAAALLNVGLPNTPNNTPMSAAINSALIPEFGARNGASLIPTTVTAIERDADGRPIRPGYVPVELKIQRELKDLKSRESELKKIRKIRQSTPDLLDSIDNENIETDDDDDSEVEHCYGPGKLRSAKSISELCDLTQSNNSISPRTTPSPDFDNKLHFGRVGGMRPAMSLAQLCDLDPEVAPSSHRLIAQWENLIQQNA